MHAPTKPADSRHIDAGNIIPSEGYCDQPYIVKTDDGAWLVTMTTGTGEEGDPGQHIVTYRSLDKGKTWIDKAAVEPVDGPEASYSALYKCAYGRVYCFYNYNSDRVPEVKREDGGVYKRVDSLGDYVFKYSDDHGKTWSVKRHLVPVRSFACDRENVYGGKIRFFWNVGRPITLRDGSALLVLHKVGAMGKGFFAQSEGAFLKSANLPTERDPEKIRFDTLPEGEIGLRAPIGGDRIAEEQTVVELSDGSLYCVYRTIDGYPACSYSRDGGKKWSPPAYAAYTPGGKKMKHPRAANFVWKCGNGKYLYWYHNHGGAKFIRGTAEWQPYSDRNPAWIAGGVEKDGFIHWSQPEILLYDPDSFVRMSYPDLVEEDGRFWVTETQKTVARIHDIDGSLVRGLWDQFDKAVRSEEGLLLSKDRVEGLESAALPSIPLFKKHPSQWSPIPEGTGLTIECTARLAGAETLLLDNRAETGKGFTLVATGAGSLRLTLCDGRGESAWETDPGALQAGKEHHVVAIADSRAKILMFVVDGVLCDGGEERQFGWGRLLPELLDVNGGNLRMQGPKGGSVRGLKIFGRALRVSEAVGHFKAR
ncbi:MAG: exo-alpha-sialidase [Spirochaetes bacterium]|nr:exo-alpha-sialidase [Spirochaetota bacterium]